MKKGILIVLAIALVALAAVYVPGLIAPAGRAHVVKGDLDGDGKVTQKDAQICLSIAIGKANATPMQRAAADVAPVGHLDGRVTAADAAVIRRMAAGVR